MILRHKNLVMRLATKSDAAHLYKYRKEGGEHIAFDEVLCQLDGNSTQYMIEVDGRVIGDIHFGEIEGGGAEIGVYIRDENERGKGYGILAMSIFIDALLNKMGYENIRIATSLDNKAMRHIAENRFGLMATVHEDAGHESYAEYFLLKENWRSEIVYEALS